MTASSDTYVRRIRRTMALGIAAVSTVAMFMGTAAPASADYRAQFQNEATSRCLGWGGGDTILPARCNATSGAQSWNVHLWRDRTSQMRLAGQNRCLDDSYRYGLRAFAPCWPGSSPLSRYQSWYRSYDPGSGTYRLRNQVTGRCLDDSVFFGLRSFACNGLSFQRWRELF